MKNRLLALMALCTATASTMPLWAAYPDNPEIATVDPDLDELQAEPGSKQVYYVYHVATGKFMNDGNWKNNWNSELVIADDGLAVTLSYGQDYELMNRPADDAERYEGWGYRMSTMEGHTAGNFHELYLLNESGQICVDHNAQGHILWSIEKQEGTGYYRISIIDEDTKYGAMYANNYLGVEAGDHGVNGLIDDYSGNYENPQMDWEFVTPEAYEIYVAKKNELKPQLDLAKQLGVECAEEEALYNSSKATVEAVQEAAAALAERADNAKWTQASKDNPMDVTADLMTNPNFDGNADGWTSERDQPDAGGNWQYQGSTQTTSDGTTFAGFWERWLPSGTSPDWSIHQDLSDMPAGHYRLTAYVLTNKKADDSTAPNGAEGLYVYATSFGTEYRSSGNVASPDGNGYAAPLSVEFDVVNGKATVGFKAEGYNSNWSGVDNFKLEFLGSEGVQARDVFETALTTVQNWNQTERPQNCNTTVVAWFDQVLQDAVAAKDNSELTSDSLVNLATILVDARDSLIADGEAYQALYDYAGEAFADLRESDFAYPDLAQPTNPYYQYLYGLINEYRNGTFEAARLDSVEIRGEEIYKEEIAKLLSAGSDVTGMMINPSFDGSNTGWTKTGNGDFKNDGTHVSEVWNGKDWEVYQELTGLPQGSYKITMQGFYDPSSGDTNGWHGTWGTEGDTNSDIKAYLFGNESTAPLPHVMDMTITPADTVDCGGVHGDFSTITWGDASIQGNVIPHGKPSAQYIFEKDSANYACETAAYVGEDGKLRLGVRMSGVTWDQAWVLFDNFQVTYLGAEDASGLRTAIEALIANAKEVLDNKAAVLTTDEAEKKLSDAIKNANDVLDNLTLDAYEANVKALNEAIESGNEAISAAAALEVKAQAHNDKCVGTGEGSYEDYSGTMAFAELSELTDEIIYSYFEEGTNFESMAQIESFSTQIDSLYSAMRTELLDASGASLDEPFDATDYIVNPSFTLDGEVASAEGWTTGGGTATSALNYEIFNDSCDVHQKIYNLPAGYYRLLWNGFYRAGGYQAAAEARLKDVREGVENVNEVINAEVFVDNGANHWAQKMLSIFTNVSDRKYDGDGVVLPDSLFPDRPTELYHVVVNAVNGAAYAFDELGLYEDSLVFHVAEGETPTIGVRKTARIENDWTIFDNFRLMYYGDGDANKPDDFVSSVEEAVAEGTAEVVATQWFTINGVRVDEPKQRGIYIRQDILADGSKKAVKVMVK